MQMQALSRRRRGHLSTFRTHFQRCATCEIRQKLLQWNLSDSLQLQRFRVHRRLPNEADEALLTEFFQDESVHRILLVRSPHLC